MLSKILASLAVILAASLPLGLTAHAKPTFTVQNDSENEVLVRIYHDDEATCMSGLNMKTVPLGETKTLSCKNDLKDRCLVQLLVNGRIACSRNHGPCSDRAIKMLNGSKLIFAQRDNGKYVCRIE